MSNTGVRNLRCGSKRTAFTTLKPGLGARPFGGLTRRVLVGLISASIRYVFVSAPGEITSVCGPMLMVPPSGPITCLTEAEGSTVHARSPVGSARESEALKSGLREADGPGTPVSELSPQLVARAIAAMDAPTTSRRVAFIPLPSALRRRTAGPPRLTKRRRSWSYGHARAPGL